MFTGIARVPTPVKRAREGLRARLRPNARR
jgi:hypothetical protein